ncbi:MAG: NUDIX domain-containing protein [Ruminococcus sp.]|nr:NUDIX domain-containing protein [Ruminococcus sp.]
MELRKTVGHRPLIQCAGSVIVENSEGQILLGKRTDNGMWGYSGGSVELDEKVEDCARRELYEEMGLEAEDLEFFMINSGPEAHYIYPNGDEVSNVEIIYICRKYRGEPRPLDSEMSELRFFSPDEITDGMISPPIREVMRRWKTEKK